MLLCIVGLQIEHSSTIRDSDDGPQDGISREHKSKKSLDFSDLTILHHQDLKNSPCTRILRLK